MTQTWMPEAPKPIDDAERERILAEFERYLVGQGQRLTRQRQIVLEAVLRAGPHVDADVIALRARELDERIGIATVYRTLQLLTESGLLAERRFSNDRRSFEVSEGSSGHHDHLICTECGAVIEFFDPEIEELQNKIAVRFGIELTAHRMELWGRCRSDAECRSRKKKESKDSGGEG